MIDLLFRNAQLGIEVSLKDLLQRVRWIFAGQHQFGALHQCRQHFFGLNIFREVLRERLKISRNESTHVSFKQSIVKVKEKREGHIEFFFEGKMKSVLKIYFDFISNTGGSG
jgi:hypothetical protein